VTGAGVAYAAAFAARCELHADLPAAQATRDPDDDFLVALARAAQADVLVSVDRDLLEAGLDDIVVVPPGELVSRLADV
jgi:predicted nucleic acid-binding protein